MSRRGETPPGTSGTHEAVRRMQEERARSDEIAAAIESGGSLPPPSPVPPPGDADPEGTPTPVTLRPAVLIDPLDTALAELRGLVAQSLSPARMAVLDALLIRVKSLARRRRRSPPEF